MKGGMRQGRSEAEAGPSPRVLLSALSSVYNIYAEWVKPYQRMGSREPGVPLPPEPDMSMVQATLCVAMPRSVN